MKKSICALALYAFASTFSLAGCGGSTEEVAPPTTAPTMTSEEQKNMEDQMKMMREQQEKMRGNK